MERIVRLYSNRCKLLDTIRGITIISMIFYHGIWNLVYIYGFRYNWYMGVWGLVWQQSICWSFILISGYSWRLGKKHIISGVKVIIAAMTVSVISYIFIPEWPIVYGILALLGTSMLIMIPIDKYLLGRLDNRYALVVCLIIVLSLFILTYNIGRGYIGVSNISILEIPNSWYQRGIMTYLGFVGRDVIYGDYFPLLPWIFLYIGGYLIARLFEYSDFTNRYGAYDNRLMSILGRHSLLIYLIHQPIMYGVMWGVMH